MRLTLFLLTISLISCTDSKEPTSDYGTWNTQTILVKDTANMHFEFPTDGWASQERDRFVEEVIQAKIENAKLIELDDYNEFIKVYFVSSRDEMKDRTGMGASGTANAFTKQLHMAAYTDEESDSSDAVTRPPIVHEMMHMVSCTSWGYPQGNLTWMNEGLATYAQGSCNGHSIEEIYRFMLEHGHLYDPQEFVGTYFYHLDEIIGYHQAAYYIQYIREEYGIDKLRELWQADMSRFEEIMGINWMVFNQQVNAHVIGKLEMTPEIDWEKMKQGCVE
ncbi:gluzincin family metallopeptidase [Phaeocystidibacter luteus]|uniref:Peptidase MA-like domain-containing protein n=1 Tax=Phaeocystidibacter luteus TaxID=911197 RepID=A0A6N6RFJ0_9FLAO|nr:hypothetical protein [Phaeocystidibacter luteus]KAB2806788.1 hypothetical protein F8C67_13040 [Phaeocystidibacter luteus]